jgi:hypothetical protein
MVMRARRGACGVPRGLNGGYELVERDVAAGTDGPLLGREVDARLDAAEPVELALDARRAGGAGHALEIEPDLDHLGSLVAGSLDRSTDSRIVEVTDTPRTVTSFSDRSTWTDTTPATMPTSSRTARSQ